MAKALTDIRSLARVHTEAALRTLAGIMRQPDAPPSARVQAASVLLDRGWGKPHQTSDVNVNRTVTQMTREELVAIAAGEPEDAEVTQH